MSFILLHAIKWVRFKHNKHPVIKHLKDNNSEGQVLKEFIQLCPADNSGTSSDETLRLHCPVCGWPTALAQGARAIAVTPGRLAEYECRI